MQYSTSVPLDRRIEVIEEANAYPANLRRVSDLRNLPYVVLLGEPGIGKSIVFETEAAREGVLVFKVRELMTGTQPGSPATLYLDALDEYRVDGQPRDKVYHLANTIAAANTGRWRLSCRSEDWRKGADKAPIRKTVGAATIVVAQLLPLERPEASEILAALGELDPKGFLDKADSLGATGFIGNPLSLKLLHAAVRDGQAWPATRYELFAAAVRRLAFEHNDDYRRQDDRHNPDEILDAAERACLLLLATGARAIWRSEGFPPTELDARAYITGHDLGLDRILLNDMLDTPLFPGEGESFEPMHRTIAEYLAGRALARTVVGSAERAAFPLSRALALVTDTDGLPPTELKGLYAWFATHLAKLGDAATARQLAEADASVVLAYGDAAVFDTATRRTILRNLDRNDPFFRASQIGATVVGGLSGEDLADDFAAILGSPSESSHRLLTVLEALTGGRPLESVRPLLRGIVLDPLRPSWQRRRALDAYLNGSEDPVQSCRELFDTLMHEEVTTTREELRAHLAARLPGEKLKPADVVSILSRYQECPKDNTVGRLSSLRRRLEREPLPGLFDEAFRSSFPPSAGSHRIEIERVLDAALASAIRAVPAVTADKLWQWTIHSRDYPSSKLSDITAKAILEWLDGDDHREAALFDAVLASDPASPPWSVIHNFRSSTRRFPSMTVVEHLLQRALVTPTSSARSRLLEVAVEIARQPAADPRVYWDVYEAVHQEPESDTLLQRLTRADIDSWRIEEQRRQANIRQSEAEERTANIQTLAPWLEDMKSGGQPCHLDWAARIYFESRTTGGELCDGLQRIKTCTNEKTLEAILSGWKHVASNGLGAIGARELGRAEAEGHIYCVEPAAMAGIESQIDEGQELFLSAVPIEVAVATLKTSWIVTTQERRSRLESWALDRINLSAASGAAALLDFWNGALDAGAMHLHGLWRLLDDDAKGKAVEHALESLLSARAGMPAEVLATAVRVSARHLGRTRLLSLAEAALADASVTGEQRSTWGFTAFVLDPLCHGERLINEHGETGVAELLVSDLGRGLLATLRDFDAAANEMLNAKFVQLVGRIVRPQDDYPEGTVNAAIDMIASLAGPEAAVTLSILISDPLLAAWRPHLRHALAQHAALRRDRNFRHPSPTAVRAAIEGGPPVNARDLRAVVMQELRQLQAELRTADTSPWTHFWNLKGEKVDKPLVENRCRDRLLSRLSDRLNRYHVAAALPEARRANETRADVLILSHAGRNLPIEVKRHFHPDIWIAASTQLQGYAADPTSDGFGIYLVFWFGNGESPTPARPDGANGPTSAIELEGMLVADLSPELQARTDVIAFDVSNPANAKLSAPRKKRGSTSSFGAASAAAADGVSGARFAFTARRTGAG